MMQIIFYSDAAVLFS
jgi:hypothetical protein